MESSSSDQLSNKPEWYILKNGSHVGPLSQKNVTGMHESGEVKGDTLLWKGGNVDWLPLSELKDFNFLFDQNQVLPSLPDIREIERLARIEVERDFPKPELRKTRKTKVKKTSINENMVKKYKATGAKEEKISYESVLDLDTSEVIETSPLPELPTFVLPDLPIPVGESSLTSNVIDLDINNDKDVGHVESPAFKPEGLIGDNSPKKIYQYCLVFLVAFCFFIPSVFYFHQKSPVRVESEFLRPVQVKSLEKIINQPFDGKVILGGAIDSNGKLHIAVNSKSPLKVYGRLKSLPNQVTNLGDVSFFVRSSSVNGYFNVGNIEVEGTQGTKLPLAGKYAVDLQVEKVDMLSKFIVRLKKVFVLKEIPLVASFESRHRFSGEIVLGQGTTSENEELIASYLKNRNDYINLPVEYLIQQLKTLESIGERFKKLFFNSTTVKLLSQSKQVFSRKFGRELAPVLQVITLSDLSEVELNKEKLNENFTSVFIHEFEKTKLISREISGLAAFVDKIFSEDGKWFSTRRIKQRKIINNEVKKIQNRIKTSVSALESLKNKFLIKI